MGSAPPPTDTLGPYGLDAAPSLFRLSVDHRRASVVVSGELDRRHRHLLLDGLWVLVATRHRFWTVDLADVTFCDTSGLAALVEGLGVARQHQRILEVVRASECVHRQLAMAGLGPLLCATPLPADATRGIHRPRPGRPYVNRSAPGPHHPHRSI
jgi:anti-anti-sigma factor